MTRANDAKIRIFLIDRHMLVRESLRMLIENHPQFQVVGDAGNCADALPLVTQQQPHVILLEVNDGQASNLECIPQLLQAAKDTRLLLVTSEPNVDLYQAVHLGAMGLVLKDQPSDLLIKAIIKIHAGEVWFDRATIADVLAQLSQKRENPNPEAKKISTLSPREKEIIVLIGEGLKNQQIADKLAFSENTVRHHLTSIFAKLGLTDRLELLIYAYQNDLARLPS